MNQNWVIDTGRTEKVRSLVESQMGSPWVKQRAERNVRDDKAQIEKCDFWNQLVACLLTSQQRSGPNDPVTKFTKTVPFPLDYSCCIIQPDVREFGRAILHDFGGIRFTNKIPDFLATSLKKLETGFWQKTLAALENLRIHQDRTTERKTANFIRRSFREFGPKQSRNLLQCLGLTRYEIPIDSRVSKKLGELGFSIQLSILAERSYCLVLDDVQELCAACEVLPRILDAAIFASVDEDGWTEEDVKGVF